MAKRNSSGTGVPPVNPEPAPAIATDPPDLSDRPTPNSQFPIPNSSSTPITFDLLTRLHGRPVIVTECNGSVHSGNLVGRTHNGNLAAVLSAGHTEVPDTPAMKRPFAIAIAATSIADIREP